MSILADAAVSDTIAKLGFTKKSPASIVGRLFGGGLTDMELVTIYRSYGHIILGWARRFFLGAVPPDDILQEVMILLMRRGATLLELESHGQRLKWLRTTTIRVGLNLARRENRSAAAMPASDPENTGERMSSRSSLSRLLLRLTEEERIIAVLHFEEGLTKADVAEQLQRSRPFIHKKLQQIQHWLADVDQGVV